MQIPPAWRLHDDGVPAMAIIWIIALELKHLTLEQHSPAPRSALRLAARGSSQSRLKTSSEREFQGYANLQPRPGKAL